MLNLMHSAFEEKENSNPMAGFMKEVIYTRYLNHPDIKEHTRWRDGNQCWVCEKWNKVKVKISSSELSELEMIEFPPSLE
jgi:hypothetical protein